MTVAAAMAVIHHIYGIDIRTPWPVAGVPVKTSGSWDVEFLEADASIFAGAASHVAPSQRGRWAHYAELPDGSQYRRWKDLFEYVVTSNARQIRARTLCGTPTEALLAYLLVDALACSMVRLGREPLHATAISTERGVVAVVGESGLGKSTLAALFVHGGYPLVTDDMLVLTREGGTFLAHAGPPRIKLYRNIAERVFGDGYHGVPMNPVTDKLIVPLDVAHMIREPQPLCAIYLIIRERPGRNPAVPSIRRLPSARAMPRILAATSNYGADEPDRLARQFEFVTRLVRSVPVKTLSYCRNVEEMFAVRDAVLADISRLERSATEAPW